MLLEEASERLSWPERNQIMDPRGPGTKVFARLVQNKIARALHLLPDTKDVSCGILTANPNSSTTEPPIAIVCEFPRKVTEKALREAQRLAWNFSRSPLLITVEPHLIRSWTCCEPPPDAEEGDEGSAEIEDARIDRETLMSPSGQAAHALQWVRLVSGDFFRQRPERFRRDGCADRTLLSELSRVREALREKKLEDGSIIRLDNDTIHDLLARMIFIQFLWDRKDAAGRAALNPDVLLRLHAESHLSSPYSEISSVLRDYDDAYRFFQWLNGRFNGDLFPGKGDTEEIREAEWREEMSKVRPEHLEELSDFVSGRVSEGQRWLWRLYSFDVIPLEFISSIYEEFVTEDGAHYTPGFLVDYILDGVLGWEGTDWDVKILDPACGSGIFLVKSYQRLIERWKNAHPQGKTEASVLRRILEHNIFGDDIDPHAVRVASFSLYLTMCDELDPKDYLGTLNFPRLRYRTIIEADFFEEDRPGFRTKADAGRYDLVIGNAPWGKDATAPARAWASDPGHRWPLLYHDIGTLFLPKALALTKRTGTVSMIQPASSLLFNISGPALDFRQKLFSDYRVEEVVNLSAMRFILFEGAKSPACVITLRLEEPNGEPLVYASPKPDLGSQGLRGKKEALYELTIDQSDVHFVLPEEAATNPFIWPALMWGTRRDLELIRRLGEFGTIESLQKTGRVITRQGANWGNREKYLPDTLRMPIVIQDDELDHSFVFLDAKMLPCNIDGYVDKAAGVSMEAFQLPQMIVKQSWQQRPFRFKAAIVASDHETGPVYCSMSYFSVHAKEGGQELLESIWMGLSSSVAVYYLLLTSGQFASAIPKPKKNEIMSVPIPENRQALVGGIREGDYDEVDRRAFEAFKLDEVDRTLVSDLFRYTQRDYKGSGITPGRRPTIRAETSSDVPHLEPELRLYCDFFVRVLKAGFGKEKRIKARIFQEETDDPLPVRLVAFHLNWREEEGTKIETIASASLTSTLRDLDGLNVKMHGGERGGIYFQRIAKVYGPYGHSGRDYPTVYIIKPDRIRYWTRSAALRDADEVAVDVRTWLRSATAASENR
jgi:hypothetical protein